MKTKGKNQWQGTHDKGKTRQEQNGFTDKGPLFQVNDFSLVAEPQESVYDAQPQMMCRSST